MPVLLGGPDINDSENLPGFYHSGGKVKKLQLFKLGPKSALLSYHKLMQWNFAT